MTGVQDAWRRYYQSAPRRLVALSRFLQSESMRLLKQTYGHCELRLHFEPFIYMLGVEGCRLTELAERLSISKQACNQTSDKLEELGYIERQADASDGRAKILMLTALGRKLIDDGVRTALLLDQQCSTLIGAQNVIVLQKALRQLANRAGILKYKISISRDVLQTTEALLMLLPRLGDDTARRLMTGITERGYSQLKPSHLELLTLMGSSNGRLKRMADIQEISVQAVLLQAKEMEALGFIRFETDLLKERQQRLVLTTKGECFLADAVVAGEQMEQEWKQYLGEHSFGEFEQSLGQLYEALTLSEKVYGQQSRMQIMAAQLKEQLTVEERRELGELLLH